MDHCSGSNRGTVANGYSRQHVGTGADGHCSAEVNGSAHRGAREDGDEVVKNGVVSDGAVGVELGVAPERDVGGGACAGIDDRAIPDAAVRTDGGLRMHEYRSRQSGRRQLGVEPGPGGAVADCDHETRARWACVGGSETPCSAPLKKQVIDIAVVEKAEEVEAGTCAIECLHDVEALPPETARTHDDERAGIGHEFHTREPTVGKPGSAGPVPLGRRPGPGGAYSWRVASKWVERDRGKRAFDLLVATLAAFVFAPVAIIVAGLVKLRLGSPLLFQQPRAGRDASRVLVPKLRSMTDARGLTGELLPDAERLTGFGAKLRATSLDELPQLWTVLRGDMSLVGPRPLPLDYVDRYTPAQRRRLEAKPGITGWAQVNGRNAVSWPERLAMDVWYVDNASLWLDIRILVATVKSAFRREGVSADGHVTMPEFLCEE